MTISITQGRYDRIPTVILPTSTETWADQSSWSSWTNWTAPTQDIIVVITDDLGSTATRLPTLELEFEGDLAVELKIADTVDGGGILQSPTTYSFVEGTEEVMVAGRYYQWTVTVSSNSEVSVQNLVSWTTNYLTEPEIERLSNVDLSTLSGTDAGREVTTSLTLIDSVEITAHDQTTWVDRYYVLPDDFVSPTDIGATPVIVSLSPLTVRLENNLSEPVQGVIDITLAGFRSVMLTDRGVQRI